MRLAAIALVLLAGACAQVPHAVTDITGSSGARYTPRPDGSTIEWRLDRRGATGRQGLLVVAQGSGCNPAAGNPNVAAARAVGPGLAVVTVEKYGVAGGDATPQQAGVAQMDRCPQAYQRGHTVSQRVEDYERVLGELMREPWWNGELVLFGGSEGGAAMAMLAPRLAQTSAVVIISTGTGHPLAETLKTVVPAPVADEADAAFARIRANAQSTELWGGASFRWWADIMDRTLAHDLLRTNAPILLIQGELDRAAPVSSARRTRELFAQAGRTNLTYREMAELDHGMKDRRGVSRMAEMLADAAAWVDAVLQRSHQGGRNRARSGAQ